MSKNERFAELKMKYPELAERLIREGASLDFALMEATKRLGDEIGARVANNHFSEVAEIAGLADYLKAIRAEFAALFLQHGVSLHVDEPAGAGPVSPEVEPTSIRHAYEPYRDYTGTKPNRFRLGNLEWVAATNWSDVLLGVCRHLHRLDAERFRTFLNDRDFKGRTRSYFATDPLQLFRAEYLFDHLYVEMNFSVRDIVKLIEMMLRKYGLEEGYFFVDVR